MASLRQIAGEKAGPNALGILVPPGRRTILILRPRTLEWDLVLLLRAGDDVFRELTRDQAAAAVQAVLRALENWVAGGPGAIDVLSRADGRFELRVAVGDFPFLVCERLPGRPYQPLLFADRNATPPAVRAVQDAIYPPPGCEREVYFNTLHFSR